MPLSIPVPELVPDSPFQLGLESLLHAAFLEMDLNPLGARLIAHLNEKPNDAIRYMDLSFILQIGGNETMAASIQREALRLERHFRLPTAAGEPAIKLLAIMAPGNFMANTPLEFLVSHADIALEAYYLVPGEPIPSELPEHDVIFVAIGESAATGDLLAELCVVIDGWQSPLLNHPLHSLCLARDSVSLLLNEVASIHMPLTARVSRLELDALADGAEETAYLADGAWPLIVRPVDSHAGKGLEKVNDRMELRTYRARFEDVPEFYISSFVDYRSADGLFRKYRIVFVEGAPFLCHMAISNHWMVHYLNADMTQNPERRAEEARAMADFDESFAVRHREAFSALHDAFPLDYFGIDCGETLAGELLIFELDTGMIVHAMDPPDMFPYKHVAMRKVFDAFQRMVHNAAGRRDA
ncbi:RimK family alpha-L-glutamate ligase [Herbaspirillum sp. WKF16]|uniref:ATP-grasp domain-containing protein n=1 Tax=Herbaspirillum sp. WKF16 TaxID=3028312 RepID=UPI0023AA0B9D|nr:RimK family alpha-L-glutamate ligase [Herbaspirillum sp. WKF16]WDZ95809.1 RimK family alpha-L-glutamate ligase [Herbaspirillum sp. WKF16]